VTVARTIAGPVFTLRGKVTPKADPHETLLAWTGFLSKAKSGHIVVIEANDDEVAHMGELSGETLMRKGVPGVVIDGGCRDVEFLIEMGFAVYARYATPRDIVGYWTADATDVPIKIGTVTIAPHDYLLADRDGIIVLPRARAAEIVQAAGVAVGTESQIRTAILSGMDPQEAYLKFGKF
jgi:regulator of RNase E activity RraA